MIESNIENQVLYISFNQDASCFAIGTEKGYQVYESHPYKELFQRNFNAGIGIIELLNRTNIIGLVGGGKVPKYAPNKVIIWDELKEEVLSEFRLSYNINKIKLKKERLFIVCDDMIYVYNLTTFEKVEYFDIFPNITGIIALSQHPDMNIIAFPATTKGHCCIKEYGIGGTLSISLKAHTNSISFIEMNYDGTLVATASIKGTLIRIYNTKNGEFSQELRRGSEQALISSIAFDKSGKFIACCSERGTTHIFELKGDTGDTTETKNRSSLFGKVAKMFNIQSNYLESQWSFAQYKTTPGKNTIAFGPHDSIIGKDLLSLTYHNTYYYSGVFREILHCDYQNT